MEKTAAPYLYSRLMAMMPPEAGNNLLHGNWCSSLGGSTMKTAKLLICLARHGR
jgi:hypothetical protein